MIATYSDWVSSYPIVSVEDPLAEEDWAGWQAFTAAAGDRGQIVGDDIFVTNPDRRPGPRRARRQVQPAAPHRGAPGRRRGLRGRRRFPEVHRLLIWTGRLHHPSRSGRPPRR